MCPPVRPQMVLNGRWQFVLLYTVPDTAKGHAVDDVVATWRRARSGSAPGRGCRCTGTPLDATAETHAAVHGGAVGKVLITVA
jgi:NADPH2:quinone reductase